MARGTAVQAVSNSTATTHTITITAMPPVAFPVPGIRKVATGDTIIFQNQTGGQIKISVAAKNVLKGVETLSPKLVNKGKTRRFEVAASSSTHEFSIHFSYWDVEKKKRRTGFAIGASSPTIIIVRPSR